MKRQTLYFRMITGSLLRRRSRMFVALLAVAVGATILSGLVTIYYDIPRQMGKEFRAYGANLIFVPSQNGSTISRIAVENASALIHGNMLGITPYRYESGKINEQPFMAAGTDMEGVKKTSPYWFVTGEWPTDDKSVLIGQKVADLIRLSTGSVFTFSGTDSAGTTFNRDYTVSGIVQTGGSEEEFIFMSIDELDNAMGTSNEIDVVECSVSAGEAELQNSADQINESVDGITARIVRRVAESEGTVLTKLQALVYLVTVVVLLLTMICVATTMMAVVIERRREIGLKKALGASNKSIIADFLGEGIFLGGCGGLLGSALGFAFAQAVSMNVFGRSISIQPLLIPITFVVSVAVTGIACMIPVKNAADVDPAIVLRGE
ncbi:MAG: ABC transporter permease [Clostridiales bacterium]|jgi:putative ABC transport system permease protein|nr:ABC transporter permease [Clostridiales bacterium]